MPLPTKAATQTTLEDAISGITNTAKSIKVQCAGYISALQAGNVTADSVFNVLQTMVGQISALSALKNTANLDTFAVQAGGIPSYSGVLTTDTQATMNAMQLCINWVMTNVPKDPTATYTLVTTWNVDGTKTSRTFTPGQTAPLVTLLQGVVATIA